MSIDAIIKRVVLAIAVILVFYGIYVTVETTFSLPSGSQSILQGGLMLGGLVTYIAVDSKIDKD